MRPLLLILLSCLALAASLPAAAQSVDARHSVATELIMMEEDGCPWCERWLTEIGGIYNNTAEGRVAPLRRVDVHSPLPSDLGFLKLAYFTPTFILVSQGREVGRIQGYPGEDFFWALLGELIAKVRTEGPREAEAMQ